jgi:putative membrane protein
MLTHGPGQRGVDHWSPVLFHLVGGYLPVVLLMILGLAYVWSARVERRRRGWHSGRTIAFLVSSSAIAWALTSQLDAWADADFGGHMAQHLLLGMVGPLGLVLGAPVTLLLPTLPHPHARKLGRLISSSPVHALTRPVVALILSGGGLVVLYFTPIYVLSTQRSWMHLLVHVHLVLAGALFAWVIAGPDPAPGRATVRTRLIVLGISVAIHASVGQLLYAGLLVRVHEPIDEMRSAGSLMYFGGDIAELLLALALPLTWRPAPPSPGGQPSRALLFDQFVRWEEARIWLDVFRWRPADTRSG